MSILKLLTTPIILLLLVAPSTGAANSEIIGEILLDIRKINKNFDNMKEELDEMIEELDEMIETSKSIKGNMVTKRYLRGSLESFRERLEEISKD